MWGLNGGLRGAVPTEMGAAGRAGGRGVRDGEREPLPGLRHHLVGWAGLGTAPEPRVEQNVKALGHLNYYL